MCLAGSISGQESQGVNLTRHTLEQQEDTTTAHNEAGKRFIPTTTSISVSHEHEVNQQSRTHS